MKKFCDLGLHSKIVRIAAAFSDNVLGVNENFFFGFALPLLPSLSFGLPFLALLLA